jgi:hypothetical protein
MHYAENEANENDAPTEVGSDELLAADDLRLPEGASVLVRLHALRAWLHRRLTETTLEVGEAALAWQLAAQEQASASRLRRRSAPLSPAAQHAQRSLEQAQQRLSAYEEASSLLEDCVTHTTTGERLLVEYYLALEELLQASTKSEHSSWLEAMHAVAHRVEQVGTPAEGEE